jgi:hypothetical protein
MQTFIPALPRVEDVGFLLLFLAEKVELNLELSKS